MMTQTINNAKPVLAEDSLIYTLLNIDASKQLLDLQQARELIRQQLDSAVFNYRSVANDQTLI